MTVVTSEDHVLCCSGLSFHHRWARFSLKNKYMFGLIVILMQQRLFCTTESTENSLLAFSHRIGGNNEFEFEFVVAAYPMWFCRNVGNNESLFYIVLAYVTSPTSRSGGLFTGMSVFKSIANYE